MRRGQQGRKTGSTGAQLARRWWRRVRRAAGQTTTEWLMLAGTLTAVALFFGQVMPPALRAFVRSLAYSIRTVAP